MKCLNVLVSHNSENILEDSDSVQSSQCYSLVSAHGIKPIQTLMVHPLGTALSSTCRVLLYFHTVSRIAPQPDRSVDHKRNFWYAKSDNKNQDASTLSLDRG